MVADYKFTHLQLQLEPRLADDICHHPWSPLRLRQARKISMAKFSFRFWRTCAARRFSSCSPHDPADLSFTGIG